MELNAEQVKSALERVATVILTWAVTKGYILPTDIATYSPIIIGIGLGIYAWYKNRVTAQVQRAAAIPGTTVVTQEKLAFSTPESNILANTTAQVVQRP